MRIIIAGCGALGCSIGARLINAGHEVQAFGRPGAHLDALRENGIVLDPDWTGERRSFALARATHDPAELTPADLVIVLVKTHQSVAIAPVRSALAEGGVCLTLQNGLGNAEALAPLFGEDNLAVGVATYGCVRKAPGVVDVSSAGGVVAGAWTGARDMAHVAEALGNGLNITWVDDPRPAIWNKLCINAMMNPVAALTGLPVGALLDNPETRALLRSLFDEAAAAAARAGVVIDTQNSWERTVGVLKQYPLVKPSMLQDVEAGRHTETDAISGGVLTQAVSENDFPHTRTVHTLMRGIDARNGHSH